MFDFLFHFLLLVLFVFVCVSHLKASLVLLVAYSLLVAVLCVCNVVLSLVMHCAILIKHGADFAICHEMYFFVMLVVFVSRASAVLKNNMNYINYKHSSNHHQYCLPGTFK